MHRGNLALPSQAFNRYDSQSTSIQRADTSLLHYGKWRDQEKNPGVDTKRTHPTRFLALWGPDCTWIIEWWDLEALHWLSGTKQNHCQEYISNSTDWWPSGPTQGDQVFQQDRSEVWLSPSSNRAHKCMEDCLQIQGRPFWMVGYALRVDKYPCYFLRLMDDILRPFTKSFVIVYLHDVLLFSKIWEEHS